MIRTFLFLPALIFFVGGVSAFAGPCDLHYTRTACPGKEAVSYKICNGKQSCVKKTEAANMEACRIKAVDACANAGRGITKSEVITASYEGITVKNQSSGNNHCLDYPKAETEFNRCK